MLKPTHMCSLYRLTSNKSENLKICRQSKIDVIYSVERVVSTIVIEVIASKFDSIMLSSCYE